MIAAYATFIHYFANRLHAEGFKLTVDIATWSPIWNYTLLNDTAADTFISMGTYTSSDTSYPTQLNKLVDTFGTCCCNFISGGCYCHCHCRCHCYRYCVCITSCRSSKIWCGTWNCECINRRADVTGRYWDTAISTATTICVELLISLSSFPCFDFHCSMVLNTFVLCIEVQWRFDLIEQSGATEVSCCCDWMICLISNWHLIFSCGSIIAGWPMEYASTDKLVANYSQIHVICVV